MGAAYQPPFGAGTGTGLIIFQTGTHPDQIGVNAPPSAAINNGWVVTGSANVYIRSTDTEQSPFTIYKTITQTQRGWDGSDSTRNGWSLCVMTDVDNNDPTWPGNQIVSRGLIMRSRYGHNGPTYGSALGTYIHMIVENSGSSINEFAMHHGYVQMGTASAPTNGCNWGAFDVGAYGPVGLQPPIFGGGSIVVKNLYNGSPTLGPSCGLAIQNYLTNGPGGNVSGATNNYPVDWGVLVGGIATGGTHDAFAHAFVAGGQGGYWTGEAAMAGDQGQIGIGFYVNVKNDGTTPCTRIGGFVSPGLGEAAGLIFGIDTTDANRFSIYRVSAGLGEIHGSFSVSGPIGVNGASPPAKAASPGTAVGTDATVINALVTLLRNLGFCS